MARVKRPDVHSKNASRGQLKYKKPNRGQGRKRQALTKILKTLKDSLLTFLKKSTNFGGLVVN